MSIEETLPARTEAVVDIRAPAARVVREVAQWGAVRPLGQDSCRLTMQVDGFDWVALILGAIGADFTVVGPPELRDRLHEIGSLLHRATT